MPLGRRSRPCRRPSTSLQSALVHQRAEPCGFPQWKRSCHTKPTESPPRVRPKRGAHPAAPQPLHGSLLTRCWRAQSRANSSLMPNSLLAGKIQGISSTLASVARICRRNGDYNQSLTSKFPTRWNRELIGPYQGIKSAYQGSFPPNQGRALGGSPKGELTTWVH